jgi:hypothetical protein
MSSLFEATARTRCGPGRESPQAVQLVPATGRRRPVARPADVSADVHGCRDAIEQRLRPRSNWRRRESSVIGGAADPPPVRAPSGRAGRPVRHSGGTTRNHRTGGNSSPGQYLRPRAWAGQRGDPRRPGRPGKRSAVSAGRQPGISPGCPAAGSPWPSSTAICAPSRAARAAPGAPATAWPTSWTSRPPPPWPATSPTSATASMPAKPSPAPPRHGW